MITASNLSMRYGGKILFKKAQLQLNPGNRYGLVGANGAGKSTLIKILSGELIPESGEVSSPSNITLGTLKQDHFAYENIRILDVILMGNMSLWQALQKKEFLLQKETFTEEECVSLENVEKEISHQNGYAAPSEAAKLLEGLGIKGDCHDKPLHTLSGGYKLRVLLAQVLFSKPDLLLLDEPTNHLDLFSIRWLEEYLKNYPGTLLLSSHDRKFLNGVCTQIIDLDHEKLKVYKGNFEAFLETKLFLHEQMQAQLETQEKKKEHLQTFIDRFGAKATKASQAASKMRLVEKLEDEMENLSLIPSSRRFPKLKFDQYQPSGQLALKVENISKTYGPKLVLDQLSFEVERGDHIAFLGPNGIGKSTLLEILTNHLEQTQGHFSWGHKVQIAYFPQDHAKAIGSHATLLTWLRQFDSHLAEERLREILARVLFSGDDVHKPTSVLSGGEKARLLLVFDEPTNHLDMESSDALCEALKLYPGTVLFVSHNRHVVSQIANRIVEITPEGLLDFRSTFEEYLEKRDLDYLAAGHQSKLKKESSSLSYELKKQEQKEKKQLEKKIQLTEEKCQRLETEIKALEEKMATDGFYQNTSKENIALFSSKKLKLEEELHTCLEEWEHLHL